MSDVAFEPMTKPFLAKMAAGIFLMACLALGGCQCPGFFAPSQHHVEGLLAKMPAGSPGTDAFTLLKKNGFSPQYTTPKQIYGQRTADTFLLMQDWWIISVELDDSGRVTTTKLSMDQNYP